MTKKMLERMERLERVWHMREHLKMMFKDIGKHLGVTASRANSLYFEFQRTKTKNPSFLDGLSVRSRNAMWNCGIRNRDQAIEWISSLKCREARNFGRSCENEVREWLGMDNLPPKKKRFCKCPKCGYEE